MSAEPQIAVLPSYKRQIFFWVLFVIFVVALPVLIFYTSGNRLDFSEEKTNIVSMGGIYLNSGYEDIVVYLDEEEVRDRRLFRQAFYLQDVKAGKHRLHVAQEGLQTWVKELPVYPYIVTEAQSFSLPALPQLRLITQRRTDDGSQVVFSSSTLSQLYGTTTNSVQFSTTTATSTFPLNPEYIFVHELFDSTSTASSTLLQRFQNQLANFRFSSETATSSLASTTNTATTSVTFQGMRLSERAGEVIAQWTGDPSNRPYYFCAPYDLATSTAELFGTHVADDIAVIVASSSEVVAPGEIICRDSIRIDRKWQDVYLFDFLPGSADFVLLQLEDGLYVTEIDDRSWQNTQLLYPGHDLEVRVDGGQIFVRDQENIFEVATTLEP